MTPGRWRRANRWPAWTLPMRCRGPAKYEHVENRRTRGRPVAQEDRRRAADSLAAFVKREVRSLFPTQPGSPDRSSAAINDNVLSCHIHRFVGPKPDCRMHNILRYPCVAQRIP
jgi:hypothetical protein